MCRSEDFYAFYNCIILNFLVTLESSNFSQAEKPTFIVFCSECCCSAGCLLLFALSSWQWWAWHLACWNSPMFPAWQCIRTKTVRQKKETRSYVCMTSSCEAGSRIATLQNTQADEPCPGRSVTFTWLLLLGSEIAVKGLGRDCIMFLCLAPPCHGQTHLVLQGSACPAICSSACKSNLSLLFWMPNHVWSSVPHIETYH